MNINKKLDIDDLVCELGNIDYKDLVRVLVPSVSFYTTNRRVRGYTLHKDYKPKNFLRVKVCPESYLKYDDVDFDKLISQKFGDSLIEFAKVILSNFYYANLTNFYNNLNELKISLEKFSFGNFVFHDNMEGFYDVERNKIGVEEDTYLTSIYHELFHMASSTYIDKIIYSGFSQTFINGRTIGDGLNEGYTQLLTERYFKYVEEENGSYEYESFIASKLEEIIGKIKMSELYLSANLYGLIKELKNYASQEEIMDFISSLDFVSKNLDKKMILLLKKKTFIDKFETINNFLVKAYLLKLKKEVEMGKLNNDDMIVKLGMYIYSLGRGVTVEGYNYYVLTVDGISNDIKKILNSVQNNKRTR